MTSSRGVSNREEIFYDNIVTVLVRVREVEMNVRVQSMMEPSEKVNVPSCTILLWALLVSLLLITGIQTAETSKYQTAVSQ